MKIKFDRILIPRNGNRKFSNSSRNIVPQNNTSTCCHTSEHVAIKVVVDGQCYNIEISNKKINEVFVEAFPNL